MHHVEVIKGEDILKLLRRCGGYYKCPKDSMSRRLGPLVAYAGKYIASDGSQKPWVGDEYANFAKIEKRGSVLKYVAEKLWEKVRSEAFAVSSVNGFVGMPMGGLKLSGALAGVSGLEDIYPEKKVVILKTATTREQSELVWSRHEANAGSRYILVEDVCNNFSTTGKGIDLIEFCGARIEAICCFLNRSMDIKEVYRHKGKDIPVIALVEHPISEYKQDDTFVSADVARPDGVIWDPKSEWEKLESAMARGYSKA